MTSQGRIFQRKRSAYWWIAYCRRGKEYRESSKSQDRQVAERLLEERLREVWAERKAYKPFIGPSQDKVTVGALLDMLEADYRLRSVKAWEQFQAHLQPIREAFGDRRAVTVTEEDIDRYIERRLADGYSAASVNRGTQLLGQAFRLGVRRHRLAGMPTIRRLPERNVRQGFFEAVDFEALLAALPEDLRDFCRFAYHSAWRKGEIASLTWADVDLAGRVIRLRPDSSKTGQGRTVALEGELLAIIERRQLARLVAGPDGIPRVVERVFHRDGEPVGDFRKAWASACTATGLPGRLFHDLRRTAIRNLVRAGVPERVVMEISGHRTRSVFDRYNITSERDKREAMVRLQAHLAAQARNHEA